ncbi:MAG: ATP-binding protein [Betaproteobacteria bacterium]|nr:ATP-binding protein [Betaproteobacteria bacterium]
MRLLPQSLFGRLVLVLLAGLVLAQLATGYINLTERGQLLYEAGGMRLAQRIADIGRLLDSLPPVERRQVVAIFNAPPLTISLDRPPMAAERASREADWHQSMFTAVLRRALGDEMPARVVRREGAAENFRPPGMPGPPDMPMMPHRLGGYGMHDFSPRGAFFTVQIALRDGSWATFDTFLSPQTAAIPVRVALTLLILLVSVVVVSLVAVRWVTGPLSSLARAADKLGADINRPPLPETGPLEVRHAARAFNTMQGRLARFIADRTRVLTAISHDLKTPITRMRLRTELLDDEAVRGKFEKDLDEMESMVTQTLDFMRDTNSSEAVQRVDLEALLESLQTDYQEIGDTVEIEGRVARPYACRPRALRRCLTNIVDNAIRYGKRASLRVEDGAERIVIRVVDEGPGIPEHEIEKAFEPFFRGEASRSRDTGGTGLGLGIARNIARAHGGELSLRNLPAGGLEATLMLPRTEPA